MKRTARQKCFYSQQGQKFVSSPKHLYRLWGPPASDLLGTEGSLHGVKLRKGALITRLHISRAVVTAKRSYVLTPSLCIHGAYKDKFIKLLPYAVSWSWGRVRQPRIAWEQRSGSVGFCSLGSTNLRVLVKFLDHCHIPPLSLRLTPQNGKICFSFVFPQTMFLYYINPLAIDCTTYIHMRLTVLHSSTCDWLYYLHPLAIDC
jgi:hypothetical protein